MSGQLSESLVMQIEVQIQQALKNLGIVGKASSDTVNGQIADAKRLAQFNATQFKKDEAMLKKLKQASLESAFGAQTKGKTVWQSQIGDFKKLNPLIMQQAKITEQAEKLKQRAIEKTLLLKQKEQQQTGSKITNAILPGIGTGIGASATLMAIGAITSAVRGLGQAMQKGVDFNAYLEANTAMFKVILKDGPASIKLLGDLQAEALKTSLNFKEAVNSSKQLLAYGFGVNQIIPTMKMLGTVTSATGGSLDDLAYVYGTLRTQGRAYTRDLMQFAMRGIPIYENLAQVMGVNVDQIKAMTEAGQVGFQEVEQAFQRMTGEGGIYAGAMEARMQTFIGMTEILEKKTEILLGKTAKLIEGMAKGAVSAITGVVDILSDTISRYQWIIDELSGTNAKNAQAKVVAQATKSGNPVQIQRAIANTLDSSTLTNLRNQLVGTDTENRQYMPEELLNKRMEIIQKYATSIGATFKDTAEVLNSKSAMTKDTWEGILRYTKTMGFIKADRGITSSDPTLGGLSKFVETLGLRAGPYAREKNAPGVEQAKLTADQFGAISTTLGREGIYNFKANPALELVKGWEKAYLAKKEDAKLLKLPDEYMDGVTDDFNKQLGDSWATALERYQVETDPGLKQQLADYITGVSKLMIPDAGRDKKAKDLAPDPLLLEKMMTEGSFSEVDNIQLEYIQSLASLTKAYQDAGITGEKLNNAQDLLATQFDIKAREAQARSASVGSNDEIASQLDKILSLREQQTKARDLAEGARTIMDSTGGYKEDGNNATYLQFLVFAKQGEEALARFTKEVDEAQAELGRLTQGSLSDFQNLTIADLQTKIAGVGNDGAGSQIASVQSAHALEMKNKYIEHMTALEMARATYDKASSDEQKKMALDIKYMVDKYNLETDLANKLNAEQIKQIQRQADLQDYEVGLAGDPKYWEDLKIKAVKAFGPSNADTKAPPTSEAHQIQLAETQVQLQQDQLSMLHAIATNTAPEGSSVPTPSTIGMWTAPEVGKDLITSLPSIGEGIGAMAKGALQSTPAGAFMSGGNPWIIIGSKILEVAMSLESVTQALDAFSQFFRSIFEASEPLIKSTNEVFINLFDMLGKVIGDVVKGFSAIATAGAALGYIFYASLAPIMGALQMIGNAFVAFADFIIEKVINPIIDFVNGFIVMINTVFGWLGVNIKLLGHVLTSSAQAMADAEKELQKIRLKEYGDALSGAIDYLRNRITEQADKMIQSAQDLFDVGAIDAQQYETMFGNAQAIKQEVDPAYQLLAKYFPQVLDQGLTLDQMLAMYHDLTAQEKEWSKKNEEQQLIALKNIEANTYAYLSPKQQEIANKQQAETLKMMGDVTTWAKDVADGDYSNTTDSAQKTVDAFAGGNVIAGVWEAGATVTNAVIETIGNIGGWIGGLFGFASGTANIPHDMIANVHKGEGIVPATFMDSIRAGDLTLSGENGTSRGSGDTYVTVVVQGSVTSERDLATNIATIISKQRRVGALTT